MKKVYFLIVAIVLILTSCNEKGKKNETASQTKQVDTIVQSDSTNQPDEAALYSCPMHSEVQGEKDSECPKCGMKLTEPVIKK